MKYMYEVKSKPKCSALLSSQREDGPASLQKKKAHLELLLFSYLCPETAVLPVRSFVPGVPTVPPPIYVMMRLNKFFASLRPESQAPPSKNIFLLFLHPVYSPDMSPVD
jgi:hypothetical protein